MCVFIFHIPHTTTHITTYFAPFSSVTIIDFEQVNISGARNIQRAFPKTD